MGDRTKRKAKAARAAVTCELPTASQTTDPPQTRLINRPPPMCHCADANCPVHNRHAAKEYNEGDTSTPKIVLLKEARLKESIPRGQRTNDTKWLNRWYLVHDKARPLLEVPPEQCTHSACPLKNWHLDKVYEEYADDLPRITKQKAARVYKAWNKGKTYEETSYTNDHKLVDGFLWFHRDKSGEEASRPSTSRDESANVAK